MRPSIRNLIFPDLCLVVDNVLPDFAARLADVRAPPVHAFVCDDTYRKIIGSDTMILPAHDFRCHVSGRARGLGRVVGAPVAGDTEVSQA